MDQETKVSSEVPIMKGAPDDLKTVDVSVKEVNREMKKEDKRMEQEEEDTTFDGGFIKVEKEGINTKGDEKAEKQVPLGISSSSSQREPEKKEKASESRFEPEPLALKVSEQESINLKLREELKEKELLVALSKDQEGKIKTANEKLTKVLQEKEILETSVAEITRIAAERKVKCDELEEKLKISDENISKTDPLLSQALSNNSDLEKKLKSMEALSSEVSQLKSALIVAAEEGKDSTRKMQEYQDKVTKLESALSQSSARILELEEDLRTALQKGAEHEDLGNSKLEKAEEKLKDLEALQVKNSSLEAALSVAMGEKKALEETVKGYNVKITESEERLVKQAREIDEATARSRELEALQKHSELSIQKAMEDLRTRDGEAKSLTEKLRLYEEKLDVASAHSFSLQKDLDQSSLENELLADTNNQLKIKIQELEGYLNAEKETAARQIEEAAKRFEVRDIEAKDMLAKLKAHEDLLKEHRREIQEASEVAKTRKMKLEESLLKFKTNEDTIKELEKENGLLAEVNLKLNQELANHGSETSDFQAMFSALEAEKDQAAKELHASKESIKELRNKLTSERERLRSKMTSLAEENNQVNEIYQSTKSELVKLQEQLEVEKSKVDSMVSEIKKLSAMAAEKSVLENNLKEVEEQLTISEAKLKEEVGKVAELTSKMHEHETKASDRDLEDKKSTQLYKELQASHTVISEEKEAVSQKHSELELTLKKSQEDLEAKTSMIIHLESQLKDLEQKVQLADAKSKETETMGKEEVQVKSRGIDLSGNVATTKKAETSHLMTLKIVLGVAILSVLIGILLGRKLLKFFNGVVVFLPFYFYLFAKQGQMLCYITQESDRLFRWFIYIPE
ncbi:Myosin heavy chain [Hirschfeldia incana]|nr:Myosin heavy chain [Hirschfeldia incana]